MGLLVGQTTTLLEGDCYTYLMNQFCEDVYFEILAHYQDRESWQSLNVVNMHTVGHIIGGDMAYHMRRIFDKAPEGFQDYLIRNDYIKVVSAICPVNIAELKCSINYYEPITVAPSAIKYDDNHISYFLPDVQQEDYYLYFKWKLKELFWQYDQISHINDVIINNK